MPDTENSGGKRSGKLNNISIFTYINADVYTNGDSYRYLVADFIAFCQTTKKPVKPDEYKFCRLFYVVPNFLTFR